MKAKMRMCAKRFVAAAVAASLLVVNPVNAGFMDDFYNSAGAGVNVTPAQAYQTGSMGVVTGGSLVFRSPQKTFQPFYFTPPSLKAGCGGIDIFLGSFGLANRAQFVQFLRNVGQNSSGLAFKVALQAMAPDLESKIQEIATTIDGWNKQFGNSCQAAKALMDSGPNQWIKETVQRAKLNMVSTGASSDYSEASGSVDTDGATAIANAPSEVNTGGKTVNAPELNILWSAFNSGDMGISDAEKELMMGLIGTTIFRKSGTGTDTTLKAEPYPERFGLHELVGDPLNATASLPTYSCNGDTDKCMTLTKSNRSDTPFARIIYVKAKGLQNSIINRTAPDQNDMRLLNATTSIPIYKIIQVASLPSRAHFGDALLEMYSMAVAWEVASHYIEDLSRNVNKMLRSAQDQDGSRSKVEALNKVWDRLDYIQRDMRTERDAIYQKIIKNGALITQIEAIERLIYGNLSSQLASNLRFGR